MTWRPMVSALALTLVTASVRAESSPPLPPLYPAYAAADALQGLYGVHLPQLSEAFAADAASLSNTTRAYCADTASLGDILRAWRTARLSWLRLSTPAVGPIISRRVQRQVDFWPVRPALLERALSSKAQTQADLDRIGGPAKGFPALEELLDRPDSRPYCAYMMLIAEELQREGATLRQEFAELARRDWASDEGAAQAAFAEWLNQWLAGLEALRWTQIEQPLLKGATAARPQRLPFARRQFSDNLADWQAQWGALQMQGQLSAGALARAPQPGKDLIAIEALLRGKGHIRMADDWQTAMDRVTKQMQKLGPQADPLSLKSLAQALKQLSTLYQTDVASALDIPMTFSGADGD